ncbi:MAG: MmgE/PrpD family protein [Candidatus Micrarchaeota archaeon]|nr:MmgE/PrpD family protein [Candidatus Micrarchaeota archaeon]MDE1834470.1 MmgE/PrpD family protein [Candidatus Micrarchaeota archaeon]MDE1859392.1 MmgE/PrpD family protein [Candidatus Micrarchaeota archaeon]
MMTVVQKIYDYAQGIMGKGLDNGECEDIKKRIADSIFVAYGARNAKPVKIAKSALLPSCGKLNSRIYFSKTRASADVAAFINGSMTRYLDYNDTYLSKEALHPSDNIPPILSAADSAEVDGKSALKAIKVAYQVVCSLADAVSIRDRGWDHVTYVSISSAAGLASLLGLDQKKFQNALSLGINNNISMRQTRAGELSMWKGCTVADAGRNSVFAALLAMDGMTGPAPIFEGEMGFFKQVSGKFKLDLKSDKLHKTMIKNHPVEYHAMSGVDAAISIRKRVQGDIKRIKVNTFNVAYNIIVKDPEKFAPKTKETADHSLPYIIAYTLAYGAPTPESYSEKYLSDKKIRSMMGKMDFVISKEFNSLYPEYLPISIEVITSKGIVDEEVRVPKGHFKDPYSWADLKNKGVKLIRDENLVNDIIKVSKTIEKRSVSELFDVIQNVDAKR